MSARPWRGAVLLAILFAACGRGGEPGDVVHRRLEGEPKTLNPILATADPEYVVQALLFRNLLDYDEHLNLVPGLADRVEESADHLTYTVHLRADARWEDGTPVTSEDIAFTLETIRDPKTPSLTRRSYFESLERVDRPDAKTARLVFRTPYAGRRDSLNLPLLPAAVYRDTDVSANPRNRRPLADGPYRLARWDPGRTLELVRNTQYFGERPAASRVVFRVVPESASAFPALSTGELDESRLTFEQMRRLEEEKDRSRVRILVFEELAYTYLGWNNRNALFSEPRVRRALTQLIDREAIARTVYGGLARPANGPLPPGLWPYDASLQPWPYDPKGAEAALDAEGFRRGTDGVRVRNGRRFAFTLLLGAGSELQRQIVEFVQHSYRKAGIEMSLRPMEWASFAARAEAGDFEACALTLNLDPNPDMTANWSSSQAPPVGFNSVFYRNPRADALMDELKATFDRDRARRLYADLQRIIHDDEPVSFLHIVSVKWGVSKRLENVRSSPLGLFLFWPGAAGWSPASG